MKIGDLVRDRPSGNYCRVVELDEAGGRAKVHQAAMGWTRWLPLSDLGRPIPEINKPGNAEKGT